MSVYIDLICVILDLSSLSDGWMSIIRGNCSVCIGMDVLWRNFIMIIIIYFVFCHDY